MATKKTGSMQAKSRKKQKIQELAQEIHELTKDKPFDLYWVWKDGDNIEQVAQALTGHSYNVFNLLNYNHIQAQDIKPGTVISWGVR